MDEVKPGASTTEFLVTVLSGSPFLLTALNSTNQWVQITSIVCVTSLSCVYMWARATIKTRG